MTISPCHVLACKRIALRRDPDGPYDWFGPPVIFDMRGFLEDPQFFTASTILEGFCADIVAEYGMEYFKANAKIVEAPTEATYVLVDMGSL